MDTAAQNLLWHQWLLLAVQVLTLVFLIVYVWKTWEMADATRQAAEASAQTAKESYEGRVAAFAPRVLVHFNHAEIFFAEIIVENVGAGSARDVTFEFDPPLQTTEKGQPEHFFKGTKPILHPGYSVRQLFDTWPAYLKSELPKRYDVTIRYTGAETDKAYESHQVLDVEALRHRIEIRRKNFHDLVTEIEKLTRLHISEYRRAERREARARQAGIYGGYPDSEDHPVEALLASWRLFERAGKDEQFFIGPDAFVDHLRRQAFTALRWAEVGHENRKDVEAVADVVAVLAHPFSYASDTWAENVGERMAVLEEWRLGDGA